MISINSDFVMATLPVTYVILLFNDLQRYRVGAPDARRRPARILAGRPLRSAVAAASDLLFQQIAKAGTCGNFFLVALHGLRLFVRLFGLDRQRYRT